MVLGFGPRQSACSARSHRQRTGCFPLKCSRKQKLPPNHNEFRSQWKTARPNRPFCLPTGLDIQHPGRTTSLNIPHSTSTSFLLEVRLPVVLHTKKRLQNGSDWEELSGFRQLRRQRSRSKPSHFVRFETSGLLSHPNSSRGLCKHTQWDFPA